MSQLMISRGGNRRKRARSSGGVGVEEESGREVDHEVVYGRWEKQRDG